MDSENAERNFVEFRRKIKAAEMLSASMQRLLLDLGFSGKLSVIVQNGRYRPLYNPPYGTLRAADEFTQLNSRLIDLQIQHRATLTLWNNFLERARRAGVPPGYLRE